MKYHVLYNPLAGNGNGKESLAHLSELYADEVSYEDMTSIASYADFLRSIDAEDVIILCGGDGTLNRFFNDIADLPCPNEILYYAKGSGNDFLRDLEKDAAAEPFSIKKYIQNLPTVEVNGKQYRFLNNVGFGIDGYCCEVGDEQKKTSTKAVNYTSIAIKGLLFHFKPTNATVTVDGVSHSYKKVWLAPTMKGRFYGGGMMATPEQDRNAPDGALSLMVFHGSGKIKTLMVFPSIFKGEHVKKTKIVDIHKGKEISVTFDRPTALQIDGETILGVTSYRATATVPATVKA